MSRLSALWRNRTNLGPYLKAAWPSFSQFGEDLAIFNLLKPTHTGTYVDVGANDPMKGSNTAYLYLRGWTGLVIEPNPAFADAFRKRRPRDTFVTAGVSDVDEALTYYEFADNRYNTFSSERAEQLSAANNPPLRERAIPCRPLGALIAEHLPGRRIDLISIDCEGMDQQVLESADLKRLQPTVLVVEDFNQYIAFRDGKTGAAPFDEYLRSQGYSPIYQCAWSSLYVADEWRALPHHHAFRPPYDLDNYMPKPPKDRV